MIGLACVKLFAFLEAPDQGYIGATSLFGAVFFMPVFYYLSAKIFKRNVRDVFDLITIPLLFTLFCARVNCLISGCCQGRMIPFHNSPLTRYPTREFELAYYIVILVIFVVMILRCYSNGKLYPLYLVSYGSFRFIIEFFREGRNTIGILHISHVWALSSLLIGASFLFELLNHSNRKGFNQHV